MGRLWCAWGNVVAFSVDVDGPGRWSESSSSARGLPVRRGGSNRPSLGYPAGSPGIRTKSRLSRRAHVPTSEQAKSQRRKRPSRCIWIGTLLRPGCKTAQERPAIPARARNASRSSEYRNPACPGVNLSQRLRATPPRGRREGLQPRGGERQDRAGRARDLRWGCSDRGSLERSLKIQI